MTKDEILSMAKEAGMKASIGKTDKQGNYRPNVNAIFSSVPIEWLERFAALVAEKEREAIHDEWHSCVMSDLEHGVKCLNEKAAQDWHKNYPAQSKMFPEWLEARAGQ